MSYDFKKIEKKWQDHWLKNKLFKTEISSVKPKYYCLDMFPYPSAAGLHVGHIEGYTASDIVSRFKRQQGYNVLHPMGWDAFGLPAEQYAIQTGNNPQAFTNANIKTFKRQINQMGKSVDWDKEISTAHPGYYKWTQWIFTKLYQHGLASLKDIEVNWCEELGTVLANDEIVNENGLMYSERGHHLVVKKPMRQWVLHITKYADQLLMGLDELDWPENLKEMQRNWIGKSQGAQISFKVNNTNLAIDVFTTRTDTLFGVSYLCLAPEHPLALLVTSEDELKAVKDYIKRAKSKNDLERQVSKEKTGVFTGSYVKHPVTQELLPIWIADYVLFNYGTGAVMAVPAHDARDYEFAKGYQIEFKKIIQSLEECYEGDGIHINSLFLDGLNNEDANNKMIDYLVKNGIGKAKITFKLRDWVFSRQRYWGEPFPVLYDKNDQITILNEEQLPLELPYMTNIKPSGTGESPLVNAKEWLYIKQDGQTYRRDTNTMPQLAGSAWYYIGYVLKNHLGMLPLNTKEAKKLLDQFLPVDLYIGGTEHAVGHLLYARFWHKFLKEIGLVSCSEPFLKLVNQGMILGSDHKKMSKSLGNTVSPDEIYNTHGADALRVYEMFMGPIEAEKPWSNDGLDAAKRFLDRVYRISSLEITNENNVDLETILHQTIKKVTTDYERLAFNTAIAAMMTFVNEVNKAGKISVNQFKVFLQLLNPIAPHITEEINQKVLKITEELAYSAWPQCDESKLVLDVKTIMIQVNGKIRSKLEVGINTDENEIKHLALNEENVKRFIDGLEIVKVLVIKDKMVSIVAK